MILLIAKVRSICINRKVIAMKEPMGQKIKNRCALSSKRLFPLNSAGIPGVDSLKSSRLGLVAVSAKASRSLFTAMLHSFQNPSIIIFRKGVACGMS
jgi:hypothetical protein